MQIVLNALSMENEEIAMATMTCKLTFTVECVAARMYQLTPAKFMPLPKSEMNIAKKK